MKNGRKRPLPKSTQHENMRFNHLIDIIAALNADAHDARGRHGSAAPRASRLDTNRQTDRILPDNPAQCRTISRERENQFPEMIHDIQGQ
ncbi:hypothetical protein CV_1030 [Chromobacterium violaceum ATCC 12472]|uniref:Uncharacterized protein n=1 Tax=Chromobacterium violaceum (strain ATCC 12472 / DSM 30191 / JCM 1249 / CCUG 213 / NBRC 12614 / NCIMB 9131 / NCTC 9757 / MK) TaxID=243365 RepID=Q7NZ92_CHRVO|nr:hypothetical protein CV_1030 [Chromobacterium violaceum ATCC 12472]